jgi:hypothetical protein
VTPEEIKRYEQTVVAASERRPLVLLRERTGRKLAEALVDVGLNGGTGTATWLSTSGSEALSHSRVLSIRSAVIRSPAS